MVPGKNPFPAGFFCRASLLILFLDSGESRDIGSPDEEVV
jgi:hypothetical protein